MHAGMLVNGSTERESFYVDPVVRPHDRRAGRIVASDSNPIPSTRDTGERIDAPENSGSVAERERRWRCRLQLPAIAALAILEPHHAVALVSRPIGVDHHGASANARSHYPNGCRTRGIEHTSLSNQIPRSARRALRVVRPELHRS